MAYPALPSAHPVPPLTSSDTQGSLNPETKPQTPFSSHTTLPPASLQPSHQQVSRGTVTKTSSPSGPSKMPTRSSKRLKKKEEKDCIQVFHAQNNPKEDDHLSGKVSCEAPTYSDLPQNFQQPPGTFFGNSIPNQPPIFPMTKSVEERERRLGIGGKAGRTGSSADEQGNAEGNQVQFRHLPASAESNSAVKKAAVTKENIENMEIQPSNKLDHRKGEETTPVSTKEKHSAGQMEKGNGVTESVGEGNTEAEQVGIPISAGHGGFQHVYQGGREAELRETKEIHSTRVSTPATKLNQEESCQHAAGTFQVLVNRNKNRNKKDEEMKPVSEGREATAGKGVQLATRLEEHPITEIFLEEEIPPLQRQTVSFLEEEILPLQRQTVSFLEEEFPALQHQKELFSNQQFGKGRVNNYNEGHLSKAGEIRKTGPEMQKATCSREKEKNQQSKGESHTALQQQQNPLGQQGNLSPASGQQGNKERRENWEELKDTAKAQQRHDKPEELCRKGSLGREPKGATNYGEKTKPNISWTNIVLGRGNKRGRTQLSYHPPHKRR